MNDTRRISEDKGALPLRARPVGRLRELGIYLRSILFDVGHRLLRRRKRDRVQVSSDYDQGAWAQHAATRDWERSPTLETFVEKCWIDRDYTCLIDDRLWRMPAPDYYRLRRHRLAAVLLRFAGDTEELVELGSGTGPNLFAMALEDHWRRLRGLELSPTGRAVAREVAAHYGIADRVTFGEIDVLDPASPGFAGLKDKVVFTHYCLEQLPDDTEQVMRNICAAGVRRAILIEPSAELLKAGSLLDLASLSYIWRQDYQRTIVTTARRLEAEGVLRILEVKRLRHAPAWRHAPTLLVFEPA